MSQALAHRGPDDHGQALLGEAGLAMRRLSIIDLERGHQPIANEEETAWIVYNGEIYNHRELRTKLISRGHRFRTSTDTEVILHLYEDHGEKAVDYLRGMFAFAIWDAHKRKLLLARDRFGQKPLFYAYDGSRLVFASEVKSLLAGLDSPPSLDLEALDDYLTLRFVPSPGTMFEGLRKLPPGHLMTLDASGVGPDTSGPRRPPRMEVRRYWNLTYLPKRRLGERDAIEEVRAQVRDAVESHLIADVPVGAFLSGGMDSSLVVATMAEVMDQPVSTFSVGVAEQDFNELPFARQIAERYATNHHEEVVWPNLVQLLPKIVYHLDEPSDPIAACMYHASSLASRFVKVVLTGDGGDEMFAGFDRYYGFKWVSLYAALPRAVRKLLLGPLIRTLPDSAGYKNLAQKARWLHDLSFHKGGRRYAEATAFFRFGEEGKEGLYSREMTSRFAGRDATDCIVAGFDEANASDDLDRMLYADVVTRLPEHSLMLSDRMTMAHSIEGRSPFLDHHLAELVATLPSKLKLRGNQPKYLMRRVSESLLPESILRRPKQGFMFPLGYWMKGPLVPVLEHLLQDSPLIEAGIFSRNAIATLLREHLSDQADHHVRLWMILNVEIWYRMYLLGESMMDLSGLLAERVEEAARG